MGEVCSQNYSDFNRNSTPASPLTEWQIEVPLNPKPNDQFADPSIILRTRMGKRTLTEIRTQRNLDGIALAVLQITRGRLRIVSPCDPAPQMQKEIPMLLKWFLCD